MTPLKFPVCKPLLPRAQSIVPYLERIDAARWYSNNGPLLMEFEEKLAQHFRVDRKHISTSSNGTQALTQILKAHNISPRSYCVTPSWTFIATPAAAVAAGLTPYFVDVDLDSWAMTPEHVFPLLDKHSIGAVIVVAPFGTTVDIKGWEAFHAQTGIPVIIDAATGFDTFSDVKTSLPFVVSLHATKVFGIGEGAVIVAPDEKLSASILSHGRFGFEKDREAITLGANAKLSEYAAAIGLASLSEWPKKRRKWHALSNTFTDAAKSVHGISTFPKSGTPPLSGSGVISLDEPLTSDIVKTELDKEGIESVMWWGKGCHTHKAYAQFPRTELPNTKFLSEHTLGLPFWIGLEERDISYIFERINFIIKKYSAARCA